MTATNATGALASLCGNRGCCERYVLVQILELTAVVAAATALTPHRARGFLGEHPWGEAGDNARAHAAQQARRDPVLQPGDSNVPRGG